MRKSGVLLHISSLPSPYGVGNLGSGAYKFVDFLEKSGQSLWQILPLCPIGKGDSPYMSVSAFAGNPLFIDPDLMVSEGLVSREEISHIYFGERGDRCDYDRLRYAVNELFKITVKGFKENPPVEFESFCENNESWLNDFALFSALKENYGGAPWYEWDDDLKSRKKEAVLKAEKENEDEILLVKAQQFVFYSQWRKLKKYANEKGVKLIGDAPIYVAYDSADVWANPENFQMNEDFSLKAVAGCPPDAFAQDGQLWGNPLYDWEKMKKDGYSWWEGRLKHSLKTCDIVRIDHFRGFESYYSIPAEAETAKEGKWVKGPGAEFFAFMEKRLGKLPLIAEDLGLLTDEVREMVAQTGMPGMKILQFAFDPDGDSLYLPHNHIKNAVVYTGTHDNDTSAGWLASITDRDRHFIEDYLGLHPGERYTLGLIKAALGSVCDTCIIPIQDYLDLGSEARMNVPGTAEGNWRWRLREEYLTDALAGEMRRLAMLYRRY